MNGAGFVLRKWISNEPELLTEVLNTESDPIYTLNIDGGAIKMLRLFWCPLSNTCQYKVNNQIYY